MTPEELGKRLYEFCRMPKEYAAFTKAGWSYDPANRVVEKSVRSGTARLHLNSEGHFEFELESIDGSARVFEHAGKVLGHVAEIEFAYDKAALYDMLSQLP